MSTITPTALYWIKILAALGVSLVVILLFFRRSRGLGGGSDPDAARSRLEQLGGEYTLLNNVIVQAERGMSTVDHVLVSPYGIFVVSVKVIAGQIVGRVADREWRVKAGGKIDSIYNPLWENRKHMHALEARLGPLKFIPLVVIVGARLKSNLGPNVIPLSGLSGFIMQYEREVLSEDRQKEVVAKLGGGAPAVLPDSGEDGD